VSSAGIGQILAAAKLIKERNGQFGLANLGENVRSVFDMCGVTNLLNIHPSVTEALAAIA
jgi:anti-anti-sigma factor